MKSFQHSNFHTQRTAFFAVEEVVHATGSEKGEQCIQHLITPKKKNSKHVDEKKDGCKLN